MSRRHKARAGTASAPATIPQAAEVMDAYSNPLFGLGFGSQSPLESTEYPLTRLSDNYPLLNSLYRDNWVVQNVVGLAVDDMLREWWTVDGLTPDQQQEIDRLSRLTALRARIGEGLRWGRLYGGAAGLIMIRGQEDQLGEPLDLDAVLPGTFAGLYILDRWSGIAPDAGVVEDLSDPDIGLPEYYLINAPEGRIVARVHHSRIVRFTGRDLPYLERIAALYWGESEIEAVYRDVVNHDNVTANMAALTFQANVNTMEFKGVEQLFALGSTQMQKRFWAVMQAQKVLRSNFGTQVVEEGSNLKNQQYTFTGLSDVYDSMCLNLCGASHYPATKLFGRSPTGLSATGESDLRNYYDYIDTQRESKLRPIIDKLLPVMAMSLWGAVPDDLQIAFPPLWTPTAKELADIADKKTESIINAFQAGLIDLATAKRELKKLSEDTGMFGDIADDDIEATAGVTYQDVTALRDPMSGIGFGVTERADESLLE